MNITTEDYLDPKVREEAHGLVNIIQDCVDDLDYFSVRNGDIFSSDVYEFNELLKRMRRQLL